MDNIPPTPEEYRGWWEKNTQASYGYCWCGCGGVTAIAKQSIQKNGVRIAWRGEPRRYLPGHHKPIQPRPLVDRFDESYWINPDGCWIWAKGLSSAGYGRIVSEGGRKGRLLLAHRVSYERYIGPIPQGMELDHLCRDRSCVNPKHLEAVYHRINVARGMAPTAILHRIGLCKNGHAVNSRNTYFYKKHGVVAYCRVCRREARAAARENK